MNMCSIGESFEFEWIPGREGWSPKSCDPRKWVVKRTVQGAGGRIQVGGTDNSIAALKDKECKAAKLKELKARKGCKALKLRGLKGMQDTRLQDCKCLSTALWPSRGRRIIQSRFHFLVYASNIFSSPHLLRVRLLFSPIVYSLLLVSRCPACIYVRIAFRRHCFYRS